MLKLTPFAKLVSEDEFELNFNIDAKKFYFNIKIRGS